MPNLEDSQNEWEVEEMRDKQQIKSVFHYLVKWAGWPSKYNFYELASHLISALKVVANYERKRKKAKAIDKTITTNDDDRTASSGDEPAPRKRTQRVQDGLS